MQHLRPPQQLQLQPHVSEHAVVCKVLSILGQLYNSW
ncbi:hypothetical protein PMIN01_08216 [Paraphaeosphaeria minitans]|uniref:Uncharacterized protein n=1 Tax=Paraphaeosphaeria minitans TaxID=565426 RepID=A0A9P6GF00_9PLEO|nr:hypothetical protein PMIN01_08216 [Paraphaeosphaeria minitans]